MRERKVRASMRLILDAPHAGKELKDELAGLRSFRVTRFRIIYPSGRISLKLWRSVPGRGYIRRHFGSSKKKNETLALLNEPLKAGASR